MFNFRFAILILIIIFSSCGVKQSESLVSNVERFELPIFSGANDKGHSSEYASMLMYASGVGISKIEAENEKPNLKTYVIYHSTNAEEISKFYGEIFIPNGFEKVESIPIENLNAKFDVYQAKRNFDKKKVLVSFVKNDKYRENEPFGFLILIWTENSF